MRKFIVFLKVVPIFLVLSLMFIFLCYSYFETNFLNFEKENLEVFKFDNITISGYTFLDRNKNCLLDPYEDDRLSIEERVSDLIDKMTIDEKIHLLKGSGIASAMGESLPGGISGVVGTIVPTPRLGIPSVFLSDGPAGLRISPTREDDSRTYYCTSFPIASLLAASWDESLVKGIGIAMGEEARDYGIDMILGPGANIHRHPLCGRNFEYYSEDPLLSGFIGAAMVNGIQKIGVGSTVKHFVANNQETYRKFNDVIISERALREIYLKGFEIIVKRSQPMSIMSSYNKVNGTYASESENLLTDILREKWKFDGFIMTDWFGGKDAVSQIKAGTDLLEPGTKKQWDEIIKAYYNNNLEEKIIENAVRRIMTFVFQSRKMQNFKPNNAPNLKEHALLSRKSASEGMVLLKNDNILPLKNEKNIALFGITSFDFIAGGTGSGDVNEAYTVSLQDGLENADFIINSITKEIYEKHVSTNKEAFKKPQELEAMFNPYNPPEINYSKDQISTIAKTSDIAIITIGRNSGEIVDRKNIAGDFSLSETERNTIKLVSEVYHSFGKKVVLLMNIGGVIETFSWKGLPDAIILTWQGGQEGGNSVTDILSGKVNPSGKLPMSFPIKLSDHASNKNFPKNPIQISMNEMFTGLIFPPKERPVAKYIKNEDYTNYEEGLYVGYRHFDSQNIKVSYPFGYGLSYTNFEYKSPKLEMKNDTIFIETTIKNIGVIKGKEVVQVYVSKQNSSIDRPIQELKSFTKTMSLAANATQTVELKIPLKELAYWDNKTNDWKLENGEYVFRVGASSRDIKQSIRFTLIP